MLNSESRQQLEERKKLNSKPAYELEPLEARIQFNKSKSIFPPQNINIKAKMMGSVNTFIGFFDDPGFQQPSFDPQPDNDQNKQVFVNGNRNFYVKVESDM